MLAEEKQDNIKVGYSTHARMLKERDDRIAELEAQILARDNKAIIRNNENRIIKKALDNISKWYDETGSCPFNFCDSAEGEECTACLKRHAVRQAIEELRNE